MNNMKTILKQNGSLMPKSDVYKENYFGKEILDPYRWLEQEFSVKTHHLQSLCQFDQYTCPIIRHSDYFYCFKASHSDNVVLELIQTRTKCPEIILDSTCIGLEKMETVIAFNISNCGTYLCYETLNCSIGQYKLHFKNIKTDHQLSDCIKLYNKSSMTWSIDNKGIYYVNCIPLNSSEYQFNALIHHNYTVHIFYHELNDNSCHVKDQSLWCCEMFQPNLLFCELNETGRYLLVSILNEYDSKNKMIFADVNHERTKITGRLKMYPIVDEYDANYKFIGSTSTHFYLITNLDAPNNKIIKVNIKDPEWSGWEDLIPHNSVRKLEHATCVNRQYLAISYIENVKNVISIYNWNNGRYLRDISVPIGRIYALTSHYTSSQIFISFATFNEPCTILHYLKTTIPMFIFHRKDIIMNSRNPCKLTAFGGFGYINQPYYSACELLFVEKFNGIFVLANIRGGGLILQGNENGGLIAAACANKRPDLFKAVILDNPLTDMLRYYKYSSTGRWMNEYGNLYHQEVFNALYSYSPIHNVPNSSIINKLHYPAILILSDLQSSNVEYVHSLKLLATLQNELNNNNNNNNNTDSLPQSYITLGWLKNDSQNKIDKVTTICSFLQIILSLHWSTKQENEANYPRKLVFIVCINKKYNVFLIYLFTC
ncbi:Prolyl endopeptidase [Schistosoma japonicum]|nr:Prolyl endopeptidase [Schistosoma japonicum]